MERFTQSRWSTLSSSAVVTSLAAVAIFIFGAPAWTLVAASWGGLALYLATTTRIESRHR